MRILIAGAGAIGSFLGGVLAKAGHDVVFLDLPNVIFKIRKHGIRVDGLAEPIFIEAPQAVAEIQKDDHFDIAIISVKAFNTPDVLNLLDPENIDRVITVQNGIGNEEIIANKFGKARVISGAITYPVAYPQAGHIIIENNKAGIGISPVDKENNIRDISDMLEQAGLNTIYVDDYRSLKWSKLLLNIICNASCAILGMTPGEIFSSRGLVKVEKEQFIEALGVMEIKGIKLVNLPGYPVKLLARMYSMLPPSVLKLLLKDKMEKGRGEKKPSLMLALESGASRTEAEFLNGSVYKEAKALGINADVNRILSQTVEDIAGGNILKEDFYKRPQAFLNLFDF